MSSKYDDLEKLADLKNKGIITEEEFNEKKVQILNLDSNKQNINGDNEPTQEETIKSNQPEKKVSAAETNFNNVYTEQQLPYKSSGIAFKIIGTIISVIILGALIITNPTKADFQNYISNRIQKSSGNTEDSSNKFLSALATLAVNQITERDNYFVCSLYTVNTTYFKMFSDKVPDNPKFLGIFGQFIPLNVAFKDKGEISDQKAESVSVPVPAQEVPAPALAPEVPAPAPAPEVPAPAPAPRTKTESSTSVVESRPLVFTGNVIKRDGRFIAYDNGTVLDSSTNLIWAAKDNGASISWNGAKNYCENYRGGGYTDWRMPTPDELAELYDAEKSQKPDCYKVSNHVATDLIHFTCYDVWGSETESGSYTFFTYANGSKGAFDLRSSSDTFNTRNSRAIPVRTAK